MTSRHRHRHRHRVESSRATGAWCTVCTGRPAVVSGKGMTPLPAPASPASPPLLAWQGGGLQLRGPVSGVFLYPTVILFAEGAAGIATAKALIQATSHAGGLSFKRRTDVRMYYRVGAAAAAAAAATAASQCCSLYAPCFEWVAVLCLALSSLLLSPTQSAHAHPCTHRCPAAPPPPAPLPPFPPSPPGAQRGLAMLPGAVRRVGGAVRRPGHHLHPRLLC